MPLSRYEKEELLHQYLLFHYGSEQDQLPFSFGPQNSLNFPVRCVTECLDIAALPSDAAALDLGCAVGRSSFELARHCQKVLAVDTSQIFISAARQLQQKGEVEYSLIEEGERQVRRIAKRPQDIDSSPVEFQCCDAMSLFEKNSLFDVILAANLLCRLPDPLTFLKQLSTITAPGGQLILTSPYSWLEEFTPRSHWLGNGNQNSMLDCIQETLQGHFQLVRFFDMSFLMREHFRKYQWGVSQASIWKKI